MADNDKMNGEALRANSRHLHRESSAASDWPRRLPSGDSPEAAGPTFTFASAYEAARTREPPTDTSSPEPEFATSDAGSPYGPVRPDPFFAAASPEKIWLELTEDKRWPDGGHAVIRLHGLRTLPADVTFTISPGETRQEDDVELLGWPEGDLRPVARRDIPEGIELIVGPDVIDSPALLPGTPVVIEIGVADIRGEVLWPRVARRPARLAPMVVPSSLRLPAASGSTEPVVETPSLSELSRRFSTDVIELSPVSQVTPTGLPDNTPDVSTIAAIAASLTAQERMSRELGLKARGTPADDAGTSERPSEQRLPPPLPPPGAAVPFSAGETTAAVTSESTPRPSESLPSAGASELAAEPEATRAPESASTANAAAGRSQIVVSAPPTPLTPVEPLRGAAAVAPRPEPSVDRFGRSLAGIALLAALLAAGSSLMVLHTLRSVVPLAATAAALPSASLAATSPAAASPRVPAGPGAASGSGTPGDGGTSANSLDGGASVPAAPVAAKPAPPAPTPPAALLHEIFSPGEMSPRGRAAKEVDLDAALALADSNIHGGSSATDLKEGEYWLRSGVSSVMRDTRMRWALTQLGSVYAAPGETAPNFDKARLMWEMAGALGDPVALCFLGNLYEYGLGVPSSRETALQWYERGLAAGGCKGIDEAISRVKR